MRIESTIAKRNPARPPRQVSVDDVPTERLSTALLEMRKGEFVEYASAEAIRADVEYHKKNVKSR